MLSIVSWYVCLVLNFKEKLCICDILTFWQWTWFWVYTKHKITFGKSFSWHPWDVEKSWVHPECSDHLPATALTGGCTHSLLKPCFLHPGLWPIVIARILFSSNCCTLEFTSLEVWTNHSPLYACGRGTSRGEQIWKSAFFSSLSCSQPEKLLLESGGGEGVGYYNCNWGSWCRLFFWIFRGTKAKFLC